MTIDINLLREDKGGNPELVRESERRRFRDPAIVDVVIQLDKEWIKRQFDSEQAKKKVNVVKKQMGERKKADKTDPCEDLVKEREAIEKEIETLAEEAKELHHRRDFELEKIGNLIDDTVPISQDEDADNELVATWGVCRKFTSAYQTNGFRPHFELLEMIGGVNFEAGRDVFGSRGYFLTGPAVLLNQALINYGLGFLMRDGYTPIQPPFMMRREVMAQVAELKDYDDVLYKVGGHTSADSGGSGGEGADANHEGDDTRFLIATSEQPITALYRNQVIDRAALPLRYGGISSCFRKEAGSHGRDIRGIFRCHQFEKIEQFCIVDPDESRDEHLKIINQAQRFYQSLGLPYRVVNIVSGEINDAASKKFDLEGWFPGEQDGKGNYRELVSASNCLDFQSRRVNTLAGHNTAQVVPHMLNSTLCATGRGICCILENYQEADGIRVPRVLVPYMAGMEFIPFTQPPPKADPAEKKGKKEKK